MLVACATCTAGPPAPLCLPPPPAAAGAPAAAECVCQVAEQAQRKAGPLRLVGGQPRARAGDTRKHSGLAVSR